MGCWMIGRDLRASCVSRMLLLYLSKSGFHQRLPESLSDFLSAFFTHFCQSWYQKVKANNLFEMLTEQYVINVKVRISLILISPTTVVQPEYSDVMTHQMPNEDRRQARSVPSSRLPGNTELLLQIFSSHMSDVNKPKTNLIMIHKLVVTKWETEQGSVEEISLKDGVGWNWKRTWRPMPRSANKI